MVEVLDRLTAGLNDAQREAVLTEASPLAILAGAGSGKTRVLTRRIARRVLEEDVDPRHVLAVTFTRKAGAELRSRLGKLGLPAPVNAGTFHSIAYAQLRQRWSERNITPPEILDRKFSLIAGLMRVRNSTAPLDVMSEIEWAKARMIPAERYPVEAARAGRTPPLDSDKIAQIFARYEEEKLRRRMVDFDDLLRLATRDLHADPAYAAARRWQHRHLFVDEFQDVNPLQFELLNAWMGESSDLCVVGDPNQAIYAWNGADASYLEHFDEHFPGGSFVNLVLNYRSSPQIIGLANTVLNTSFDGDLAAAGSRMALHLAPTLPDGPMPTVTAYPDETAEAQGIARALRDAHAPGRSWGEQAVLVRTNAQLPIFEETLRAAGIPFRSRGSMRFLDRPEVKDALQALRRGPGRLAERLAELDESVAALLPRESGGAGGTTDAAVEVEPVRRGDADQPTLNAERATNLAELVRLGREYLGLDPGGTLMSFQSWMASTLRSDDGDNAANSVDLSTFHAAKGLEWAVVHIAGLEEGLVPIHYATTPLARSEERRLLYVALTRAERVLSLSYAERRTFGARALKRRPSPSLEAVSLAIELLSQHTDPVDLGVAVARQRELLRAAAAAERPAVRTKKQTDADSLSPEDRRLLDALKEWRRTQSRAANVPAYVIFNDATLIAVAADRPRSHTELLSVAGIGAVKAQRFGDQLIQIVIDAVA